MSNTFVYKFNSVPYINLTNNCCNDCSFCLRQNADSVTDNNSLWLTREPTADEVIGQLKTLDFDYSEAVFCGYGESTYRLAELLQVASFLKANDKKVRLNTNGLGNQINNRNIVPALKGLIDVVSVSLNSATAEKYAELCRPVFGLESFNHMLDFAADCSKNGIETILTIVDILPKDEINQCAALAKKVGAKLKIRKLISNNVAYS